MLVRASDLGQELIRRRDGTVAALPDRIWVLKIAAAARPDEVSHVSPACDASGRVEVPELVGGAYDVRVSDAGREHGVDEVREGREAVHEDPKAGEDVWGREHAAKDERQREHQVRNVPAYFGGFDGCNHHTGEGAGKEEKLPNEQEHEAAALGDGARGLGVAVEPDRVVPAKVDQHCHQ